MPRQPAIYIPHGGGPWPFMADDGGTWASLRTYLESLPSSLPAQPDAIAVITAHWEAPQFTVVTGPNPALIYDYYGFPPHTYEVKYDAPGAPEVANRAVALANAAGIECIADSDYGWDHGVFVPVAVSWPEAQIPVVAISLKQGLSPAEHISFGASIEALRDDNILVVGSGLSIHDLSFRITPEQAATFDAWLEETMGLPSKERNARLVDWKSAPEGPRAHPREEHLIPLMTVVGAGGDDAVTRTHRGDMMGLVTAAYRFG